MDAYIKVGSDFYLLASSLASRRSTRVLANHQSFAVFDASGDISCSPLEALGFFHSDTRFLSRFELRLSGEFPHLLNSYTSSDKTQFRINLTNPDLREGDSIRLERDSIHLERSWVLDSPVLFHRVIVRNFTSAEVAISLSVHFGADFADLFEVRGVSREAYGVRLPPELEQAGVRLSYRGRDGLLRVTRLGFSKPPDSLTADCGEFKLTLQPGQTAALEAEIAAELERAAAPSPSHSAVGFERALARRRAETLAIKSEQATITTNHEMVNRLLGESQSDLTMLIGRKDGNCRVTAGIPWFATLFGRDSLLTALSMLPFDPGLASGCLRTLAALQGRRHNAVTDEAPGKIIHEMRDGEMARLGEVPFARYYGSVDSTPLFLLLLGRYVQGTADLALAEELWPNVEAALQWIERDGDCDGDGYVEYQRETPRGLANQGWKDSRDSISHADGTLAQAPIALCEVQGYVYGAYLAIGEVAARLGREDLSAHLDERAVALKTAFQRDFWLEAERTVALALDGDKRPCRVRASNAAHCLAAGLLDSDRAQALGEGLLADDMFSGWGIRTLGARERRYNPMSYHNGSIWPHDNAIAMRGLARTHQRKMALKLVSGLFEAALDMRGSPPELFCGFQREPTLGPVPYPVACHPQAWAAASVYMMVSAMLGMEIDAFDQRLVLDSPFMPAWLDWLRVDGIRVGESTVSFLARRPSSGSGAAIEVIEKRGSVVVEIRN